MPAHLVVPNAGCVQVHHAGISHCAKAYGPASGLKAAQPHGTRFRLMLDLEVSTERLLPFDGLEQCLEITLPEAAAPLALDNLIEQGRAILDGLGEDLQHVPLVVPVYEDSKTGEVFERFIDLTHTGGQLIVIARWNA